MLSDEWLPRYRLLENFTAKWNGNGNGNAYERGDYNSSFALRAVELKIRCLPQTKMTKITDSTVELNSCIEITGRWFKIVTNRERSVSYL